MQILLLLALLQHPDARPTVPAPVGKQERIVFYDAQHKHCAILTEREAGYWYAYLDRNNEVSPDSTQEQDIPKKAALKP